MIFKREHYSQELMAEMAPLWSEHHAETANKFYGPLDPHLEMYEKCDLAGVIRFFTVRHQGRLVGYQVFIVSEHLHSRDMVQATQDILYLKPEHRRGLVGYRFLKWCMNQLKEDGIAVVHQVISARNDFGKILERMGYQLEDMTYSKLLQEVA